MTGRPGRAVAILVVLAAVAAGCSGRSSGDAVRDSVTAPVDAPPPGQPEPVPTTTTLPPTWPLTGRPLEAGAGRRAALSVKIDNIAAARPQAGISSADVIYEEFTEGITRFIVVFHSGDAEVVGPVRSVRPADPVIVRSLGGVLAFSGGSPAAVELAAAMPLTLVTENDRSVMYRRSGRSAPQNLYTSTEGLRSLAGDDFSPPARLAPFLAPGQSFGGLGASPVARIDIVPAPFVTASYTWDPGSGAWLRSTDGRPHLLEEGGRIAPTTVVIQFVPYVRFVADAKVQYPEVIGTGEVWILANGNVIRGSWSKPAAESPTAFTDAGGDPIPLPPGQTWFHLVSPGAPVSLG